MSEETRTMQSADPAPASAPEEAPALVKKIELRHSHALRMFHIQTKKIFIPCKDDVYIRHNSGI